MFSRPDYFVLLTPNQYIGSVQSVTITLGNGEYSVVSFFSSFVSHQFLCIKLSCKWILIWQSISFAAFSMIPIRRTCFRVHVWILLRLNAHHKLLNIATLLNFLSNIRYLGATQNVPEKCGNLGAWFIWISHELSLSHAQLLISDWSATKGQFLFKKKVISSSIHSVMNHNIDLVVFTNLCVQF